MRRALAFLFLVALIVVPATAAITKNETTSGIYTMIQWTTSLSATDFPWCYQQDVFFYNTSSDLAGYRKMDHIPELDGQRTVVSPSIDSSTGEKTIGTWLTDTGNPGATTLAPGLWRFRFYARSSSDAGTTTIKFRTFNRSADGTITWLFFGNAFSKDILAGSNNEYLLSYARRNYTTFFAGDRLGVQINVSTDSAAARTVSLDLAGNTNASMVSMGYFICCDGSAAATPTPEPTIPNLPAPPTDKWLWSIVLDWWWIGALLAALWLWYR